MTSLTPAAPPESDREPVESLKERAARLAVEMGHTPARTRVRSDRFKQLRSEFGNQYVAYRERWDGDCLVEPFVLVAAPGFAAVEALLRAIPLAERDGAIIRFILAPGTITMTPRLW